LGVVVRDDGGPVVRTGGDLVGADRRERTGGGSHVAHGDVGAVAVDAADELVQGADGVEGPHGLAVQVHEDVHGARDGALGDLHDQALGPGTRGGGRDLDRRGGLVVAVAHGDLAGGGGGSDDTGDVR